MHDETGLFDRVPEQVIVNEYRGAQGIAEHADHPGFGPAIATVSLLADWEMNFAPRYRQPPRPALLENGSCPTMTGLSRSRWTHCIPARRAEPGGRRRGWRISLTFRTVRNRDGQNTDQPRGTHRNAQGRNRTGNTRRFQNVPGNRRRYAGRRMHLPGLPYPGSPSAFDDWTIDPDPYCPRHGWESEARACP